MIDFRIGLQKPDWSYIGSVLARSGSDDQIEFFRAFLRECNSWGTHYQIEQQLAHVNNGLTKQECEQLQMLSYVEE